MQKAHPSRRALLAGAGLTVLAGCSTYGGSSDDPTPGAPPVPPVTSAPAGTADGGAELGGEFWDPPYVLHPATAAIAAAAPAATTVRRLGSSTARPFNE